VKETKPSEEIQEAAEAAIPDSHVPVSLKQADEVCVLDVATRFTTASVRAHTRGVVSRPIYRLIVGLHHFFIHVVMRYRSSVYRCQGSRLCPHRVFYFPSMRTAHHPVLIT
jgi:hypothetical protein